MLKLSTSVVWRLGPRATLRKYSSVEAAAFKTVKLEASKNSVDKDKIGTIHESNDLDNKSGLLASVFANLNTPDDPEQEKKPSPKSIKHNRAQQLESQILKASDVDSLLLVAENPVVSRHNALKMLSKLLEWTNNNNVKLADFEKDPRFLKLCRIIARTSTAQTVSSLTVAEDLSTVLGVTGDDEAARLIGNLALPQTIKVMKALHQKGRRSTPLLRALSHNIIKQSGSIDLKKSADLLFCMASLNFPDPALLDRICSDIIENLPMNQDKPAVVNSIVVSLGLLKCRHEAALTAISDWMQNHKNECRASDIASAVITLATVDFIPPNSESLFETAVTLKEDEMTKSSSWLDLVFSLLILNKAEHHHLVSTLKPEFIEKLLSLGEIPIPSRRKLMTIDAYVSLVGPPHSPRLPDDVTVGVPLVYAKEKMLYVQSIMDTFKSLVSSEKFLKRECNSGMGFLYDAEFAVDDKCHPVPLEKAANDNSVHRIAVLGLDYHDMTCKISVPTGINQLYTRLLQSQGYKVLQIPYTEFNPKDKLVTRVQYIEKRLKEIVSDKSAPS